MRGDMNKKPKSLWHVAGKKAWIVAAIYGIVRFFFRFHGLYERQLNCPGQS